MGTHRSRLRVRFSELDPYAHVNHTVYLVYFEAGRLIAWGLPNELLGQESLTALAFRSKDHLGGHAPDED